MTEENSIKVSIVVCSYNQDKYIRQTLYSIVSQKHPYTWELIVCDDASIDSTPQIITDIARKHKEIIPVLRKKNLGIVKNFIDGLSKCRGEYIMICGGDDYWFTDKIYKEVNTMDADKNIGLCGCDAIIINKYGERTGKLVGKSDTSFESLLKSNFIPACSICFRKNLMQEYFKEISPISHNWKMEDYPIVLWFAKNSRIEYIHDEYVAYRILDQSASHHKNILSSLEFALSTYDIRCYFSTTYFGSPFIENIVSKTNYYLLKMRTSILKNENIKESIRNYRKAYVSEFNLQSLKIKLLAWFFSPKIVSKILLIKHKRSTN